MERKKVEGNSEVDSDGLALGDCQRLLSQRYFPEQSMTLEAFTPPKGICLIWLMTILFFPPGEALWSWTTLADDASSRPATSAVSLP